MMGRGSVNDTDERELRARSLGPLHPTRASINADFPCANHAAGVHDVAQAGPGRLLSSASAPACRPRGNTRAPQHQGRNGS